MKKLKEDNEPSPIPRSKGNFKVLSIVNGKAIVMSELRRINFFDIDEDPKPPPSP